MFDLVIVGGSAAAAAAGVYAARRNLNFKIITKDFGGEVATSGEIGNWPGINQTDGITLSQQFRDHLEFYKAPIEEGIEVQEISKNDDGTFCINAKTDSGTGMASEKLPDGHEQTKKCDYTAKTVIIATGVHPKELGSPGEKEFRNKGVSYCTTCFPAGSMIVGNNEPQPIEKFNVGDRVLTDNGTYQHITRIMNRPYKGELIRIKTRFFLEDEVKVTPNHPILATTLLKGKSYKYWDFSWGKLNWIPAGELTKNHLVAYPIVKETRERKSILISEVTKLSTKNGLVINRRESPTAIRVKDKINLDAGFYRLAGYYLAEGTRNGYTVSFYFNRKETDYIKDVENLIYKYFKIRPNVKTEGSVTRINIWSTIVAEFFDSLFSHYSYNKSLPHWVTILPLEKQRELLLGLWRGDGCRRYKDYVLVTNSHTLTVQVKNILLRFNIISSIRKIGLDKLRPTKIGNRIVHFKHPKYEITVGGPSLEKMSKIMGDRHPRIKSRKRVCSHAHIRNGYVLLPIREIGREYHEGTVYNLAVNKNHSYVTTNSAVHNCDGPLFKNKVTATIGGGNSALESALMLAGIASQVYVINKNPAFKGDQILIDNLSKKKNVEVIYEALTQEIAGEQFVNSLKYKDKSGLIQELKVDGIFVHIGQIPNSKVAPQEIEKDEFSQIKVNKNMETNVPGLYAAGDVTDVPFKQIVIAAGQGCIATLSAVQYLNKIKQ